MHKYTLNIQVNPIKREVCFRKAKAYSLHPSFPLIETSLKTLTVSNHTNEGLLILQEEDRFRVVEKVI